MVDFTKLAQAVDYLIVIFPEIARTPKYQPSLKKFVANLQMDLWTLYNAASHAELKAQQLDSQWIAGRRAWLLLDKFSNSKRVIMDLFCFSEEKNIFEIDCINIISSLFVHYSTPGSSQTIPRYDALISSFAKISSTTLAYLDLAFVLVTSFCSLWTVDTSHRR